MKNLQDTVTLANGVKMPWLGLGVFKVEEGQILMDAVSSAITNGYRSIDTAAIYGNERGVGEGIKLGLKKTGISRSELFITTKVWTEDLGYEETIKAFETSLEKLGLDYIDLYLIHWPKEGKYLETWKALETLYREGKIKSIGVSNFQIHHLETLLNASEIKPMINQIELHPKLTQKNLLAFCESRNIQVQAWSPLMQGKLLDNPLLRELAHKYQKSVAQVIIRWDLQNGIVTIPKSVKEQRIIENGNVFDFCLTKEEMKRIDSLNQDLRVGPDPDNFDF
ncbi:aldo/keto reductase [Bacillus sp. B1-b2]|uniref:aldo/keto reductase n=1 Tax=Bacillus sp. B1-b2 TaxID=2653201 RepID=UPI0012614794|nr:aldo/keto reductase [Bacillus sp. B1-b2]KAB7666062.1 aldo/keto reductase [Bacillus sp. B1-b2]